MGARVAVTREAWRQSSPSGMTPGPHRHTGAGISTNTLQDIALLREKKPESEVLNLSLSLLPEGGRETLKELVSGPKA